MLLGLLVPESVMGEFSWVPTGAMLGVRRPIDWRVGLRTGHTTTLLPNGKVLAAGGWGESTAVATAEIFDPPAGTWRRTGSMETPRANHTATLLPDGRVLVVGGFWPGGGLTLITLTAEIYDPRTETWSSVQPTLGFHVTHTATLLPNDKVLVIGGEAGDPFAGGPELFDPETGGWTPGGNSAFSDYGERKAVLLRSGKVLFTNGWGREIYDPESNEWSLTPPLFPEPDPCQPTNTLTLLPDGRVLLAGPNYAGIFDPATNTCPPQSPPSVDPVSATLLPNGTVLVAGTTNAETYDPAT